MTDQELARRIRAHPWWFHTIDLGDGLVTRGEPVSPVLSSPAAIPEVRDRSVLDIGAWDGKYSFEAERAGAAHVVALDHYVWRLDSGARQAYCDRCEAEGRLPDPQQIDGGFFVEDGYPGKVGFDLVHEYLDSKVDAVVDDFMTMDLDALGSFDVVFYFGVLYHMVDPLRALHRVRQVTKGVAAIETAITVVPGYEQASLIEFFAGKELNADYGNWFAPSEVALHGMCRAAGFARVSTASLDTGPSAPRWRHLARRSARPQGGRIVVHAFA